MAYAGRYMYAACVIMQRRQSGLKSGVKSWIRVNKISNFPDKFVKNFNFFRQFKNIDFPCKKLLIAQSADRWSHPGRSSTG